MKFWTTGLDLNLDVTKEQNKRTGFSFDNMLPFGKNVKLDIEVEKNNYTDWQTGTNNFGDVESRPITIGGMKDLILPRKIGHLVRCAF